MTTHTAAASRSVEATLPSHLPVLDGIRGLAILLVVPHNLHLAVEPQGVLAKLFQAVLDRGWIGVQLFFVLSGFLITRILIRTSRASNYYQAFFVRRALRIWPLYYFALLLFLCVLPAFGMTLPHDPDLSVYLWLFLSNFVQPLHPGGMALPHFWSLAVEEQFYLLWPFIVYRRSPTQILKVCAGVVLLALASRVGLLWLNMPTNVLYEWTPCRMDALALGAAAAACTEMPGFLDKLIRKRAWLDGGFVLLFVAGALVSKGYDLAAHLSQSLGYLLLAAAFSVLVLRLAIADHLGHQSLFTRVMRSGPLGQVGKYSFGMYVFHVPLGALVLSPLAMKWGWGVAPSLPLQCLFVLLCLLGTYGVAMLSYHVLERHFLNLKARLAPILR